MWARAKKIVPKQDVFGPSVPIVNLWDALGRIPGRWGKIQGRMPYLRDDSQHMQISLIKLEI